MDYNERIAGLSEIWNISADCPHEIFAGEEGYYNKKGKLLCIVCVEEDFKNYAEIALSTEEKAELMGYVKTTAYSAE